ncbi:MAG: hypothetical protein H7235_02210 [Bdellovibrionaceae bacterium]|nr:hypothetical protein [Pseudobdellovibrionaceae bacterium]
MKIFLAAFALLWSAQLIAATECIDLTGIYKASEKSAMRFTQVSCVSLKIEFGQIQKNGKINWYKIPLRSLLNGSPTCDPFGCIIGNVIHTSIELSRDKAWVAYDPTYGDCSYNQVNYSFRPSGDLIQRQSVYDCRNGYVGPIESTLTILK